MTRTFEEITADFNSLNARDFNLNYVEANGLEQLVTLTDELL
jgi:hypothetical protein